MGYFTWTFANRKVKSLGYGYASSSKLGYGYKGYIALPKGSEIVGENVVENSSGHKFIKEEFYDGYGMFGSFDVYNVVVDINKGYIKEALKKQFVARLKRTNHSEKEMECDKIVYDFYLEIADLVDNNADEDKIIHKFMEYENVGYGFAKEEWKRYLGIHISCYKEDNELLKYPLKIVSSIRNIVYEDLPISITTQ